MSGSGRGSVHRAGGVWEEHQRVGWDGDVGWKGIAWDRHGVCGLGMRRMYWAVGLWALQEAGGLTGSLCAGQEAVRLARGVSAEQEACVLDRRQLG